MFVNVIFSSMSDCRILIQNWKKEVLLARCKHCVFWEFHEGTNFGYCTSFDHHEDPQFKNDYCGPLNFACPYFEPKLSFKVINKVSQLKLF